MSPEIEAAEAEIVIGSSSTGYGWKTKDTATSGTAHVFKDQTSSE
jgi:hypothetical protein